MKKLICSMLGAAVMLSASAESVTAKWEISNPENLGAVTLTGSEEAKALLTTSYALGSNISKTREVTGSNADTGYEAVEYTPAFTAFMPTTKVTAKTAGHCVSFTITPQAGHKFLPKTVAFDAIKVGTDGGGVEAYYKIGSNSEAVIGTGIQPARNKISSANSIGYSHHEFSLADVVADGQPFTVYLYIMNINGADNSSPKEIGFRNLEVKGALDEEISAAGGYVKSLTFTGSKSLGNSEKIDITSLVSSLKNGGSAAFPTRLFGDPSDFELAMAPGYEAVTVYKAEGHTLNVSVMKGSDEVMKFSVRFKVTNMKEKPAAKPLNRGLMSINLAGANMGSGNLVSWRHREADGYGVKYKLYRCNAEGQEIYLAKNYIIDRTNFSDTSGKPESFYKLEVYDSYGNLLDTEIGGPTWSDQTFRIPTETPIDEVNGATYTPNDASYCDMDGDGEYEIILKWSPSNEKDAASSGVTSPAIFDCLKLDGTRLWRINAGPNFFTSAHTMQFIAWDFDGDGYGEFMMKTAPGTIDGEGNYVLLGDDDPFENFLSGRGKQDHGPEYITVFDGLTGGELATIPYHTAYKDVSTDIWGDSNQNRSERYLAGLAYLDGPDANPSPIFARGYYSGAFVGAYDWDGTTLKERWVSRNTTKGQGLWGEGAHWMACGDCDGDGKHEIVYGSAALDHDGKLLYRTGLGHGDALHLGDFLPDREGLEVFMVHEASPYGCDLRDAKTGKLLLHPTASGDTGRGIAGHFDSFYDRSQFTNSADPGMHDCLDGTKYSEGWNPGGGGSMNNRIYWDGDLYDEHYDKSVLAKWDHNSKGFGRIQVNAGNYTIGNLNNSTKYNPCVLGDLLGDWREEIVLWDGSNNDLIINATSYPTKFRLPHLMDDLNYRVQVVNQNCCYNQPPHLSVDPAIVYADNPNHAVLEDIQDAVLGIESECAEEAIYNLQGIRVSNMSAPGIYVRGGKKIVVK